MPLAERTDSLGWNREVLVQVTLQIERQIFRDHCLSHAAEPLLAFFLTDAEMRVHEWNVDGTRIPSNAAHPDDQEIRQVPARVGEILRMPPANGRVGRILRHDPVESIDERLCACLSATCDECRISLAETGLEGQHAILVRAGDTIGTRDPLLPLAGHHSAEDPLAIDPLADDLVAENPLARDLVAEDLEAEDMNTSRATSIVFDALYSHVKGEICLCVQVRSRHSKLASSSDRCSQCVPASA